VVRLPPGRVCVPLSDLPSSLRSKGELSIDRDVGRLTCADANVRDINQLEGSLKKIEPTGMRSAHFPSLL
jgi:hypothetical protein